MIRNTFLRRIIFAGIVGWIGINIYMSVLLSLQHAATPLQLFQWDASNALGAASFSEGFASALLGLFFDFVVNIAWATLYVMLFDRKDRTERPFLLRGILFGAVVMVVMRWLVVPLGHAVSPPATPASIANLLAAHIISFGIPIAYVASRIGRYPSRSNSKKRIIFFGQMKLNIKPVLHDLFHFRKFFTQFTLRIWAKAQKGFLSEALNI
uniref:Uncharacterized protein n=1 Tax=mine drainage metagenome TaxID=410659 RepID=E6PHB4_9ZZZZ